MTADPKAEQYLALKVMRLTRPVFALANAAVRFLPPTASDADSEPIDALLQSGLSDKWGDTALSSTLVLPQSFGSIFLGETFVCYLSLHNDSTETCEEIQLTCHLQTVSQRIPLLQTPGAAAAPPPDAGDSGRGVKIDSGESIDHVLSHEVKELGTHILVCEVTYNAPAVGRMNFRKYFKFQVMKPLDVKTKFYSAESDDVFVEAQVQNVTTGPLCLEKVGLEPSPMFKVNSMNHVVDDGGGGGGGTKLVFGKVNCLQPQDARQYLFCLTPRNDLKMSYKQLKGATNIGKLDIIWRTNFGDRGRLQTSQLQRIAPNHGDIRLNVESVPSIVVLGRAFTVSCSIFNNSERTLDLELTLDNVNMPRMLWSGGCSRKLGLVEPSRSIDVELEAIAQDTSLQSLSGIKLTDSLLTRSYQFDHLCTVYVCKDEDFLSDFDGASVC